jgi:hypothetical protein
MHPSHNMQAFCAITKRHHQTCGLLDLYDTMKNYQIQIHRRLRQAFVIERIESISAQSENNIKCNLSIPNSQ